MKTWILILAVMAIQSVAAAKPAIRSLSPTAIFLDGFVQALNDQLEVTNTERTLKGGRLYCAQVSDDQQMDLEGLLYQQNGPLGAPKKYLDLAQVPASQFLLEAADRLNCYPTFWPTKGRDSVGGFLFNSKSFVMDHLLLKEALNRYAGRVVADQEALIMVRATGKYFKAP